MTDKTNGATASASVAFPVASLAVFTLLILKLADVNGLGDLSWWWVFSPWLISIGFVVVLLLVFGIVFGIGLGIATLLDIRKSKKRAKALAERKRNTLPR